MGKAIEKSIKGLLTFVVPSTAFSRSTGGTVSARYCYAVYLRHLVMMSQVGTNADPETVAELGPGDSIGIGLAALIGGAQQYYGFDAKSFVVSKRNLAIFDELVALFQSRAAIPDNTEFSELKPLLDDYRFPHQILTEDRLSWALAPDRVVRLRAALAGDEAADGTIAYRAPWHDSGIIRRGAVDWIFSQAVMEHVDNVHHAYGACFDWLKPGGIMSHTIDFRCHGTAEVWNGHLAYSDPIWWMMRGARPYLLNRLPHSAHRRLMIEAGFEITLDIPEVTTAAGLRRFRLARRFADISDDDLKTSSAFIISRKPMAQSVSHDRCGSGEGVATA